MLLFFSLASWGGKPAPKNSAGGKEGSIFYTLALVHWCHNRGLIRKEFPPPPPPPSGANNAALSPNMGFGLVTTFPKILTPNPHQASTLWYLMAAAICENTDWCFSSLWVSDLMFRSAFHRWESSIPSISLT